MSKPPFFLVCLKACFLFFSFCVVEAVAEDSPVMIYTEDFPPYSFSGDAGVIEGTAMDVVGKIMAASGLKYEVRLLPWARAYREAMNDPRGLIFSLARSKVREDQFDWLAFLAKPEFYLFGRADDNRLVSIEAIKQGGYTAICEDIDASCMILEEAGFPRDRLFNRGDGGSSETTMIEYGRVDFYLGDILHHPFRMASLGLDENRTKPILKVGEGFSLYLAAGKHVDTNMRLAVKAAYKALVADAQLAAPPAN